MFLDIGVGILVAIFSSATFHVPLSMWMIVFCIAVALLPDIDFLYFYPKKHDTKYDHKHRDLIHYPLLMLPIGTSVVYLLFGKMWAMMFFLGLFSHFVHDSIGIGWGVKWFYPFNRNNYSFFYLVGKIGKKGRKNLVFTFREDELPGIASKYGDPNWVKNIYFKWHPYAQVEFVVFIISLLILFLYIK